jgi:hypothetical protein
MIRTDCISSCNSVYQLLAHGRWFSPGTSASSTTKTDIVEILLKVALTPNINQSINQSNYNATCIQYKNQMEITCQLCAMDLFQYICDQFTFQTLIFDLSF